VSLPAYQTANPTKDINSTVADAGFANPPGGNYKPTNVSIDNIGNAVGVSADIMGVTRGTPPDPGAYEFTVAPIDAGVLSFVSPNTSGCYSSTEVIEVVIKNFGSTTLDFSTNPLTVEATVAGPVSTVLSATPSGTLASGATLNVSFPSFNMIGNGTYTFTITSIISGDGDATNDVLSGITRTVGPVGGTVSSSMPNLCVSGSPVLTLSGNYGGSIQWQESTVGASGPWTNVGTGTNSYAPGTVTQTTWYQAEVGCNGNTAYSNALEVAVNNPSLLSTTPGSRCGIGTVNLEATANPGTNIRWFSTSTGGVPLFTGSPFTTPTIAATTTYYAEPLEGIGGQDSISATIGGTTGVNHHMFVMTSPTGMTLQEIGIKSNQALGTLTTWEVYYRPNNYQLTPGANTSSAGWILLSTATNIPSAGTGANDYTYIAVGQSLAIPAGATYSFYIAPAAGTTHAYNTTALGVTNSSNANAILIGGNRGSTLFNCSSSGGIPTVRFKYSLGCIGIRVPVVATINTPPTMTVTAVDPTLCPGGNTTVNVSSSNDPNYTYTWTSNPAGFTASGAGPHAVAPSNTTTYIVSAVDNTAGSFSGCANVDSVTVITAPALLAGTVSSTLQTICISGTPTLSVSGSAGGAIQWQESNVSASGPWTNVGTGATSYTPASAITQTTYYKVEVSCQSTTISSNVVTVTVNNPQILSTVPGQICSAPDSATISATASAGAAIKWYDVPAGGTALATGASFTTPILNATTTYYAEPSIGGGGGTASPLQVTEIDLGTNDQIEIQNVSPDPLNVTGWKVVVSNSYTDINNYNTIIQVLSGTMNPGDTKSWTDLSSAPNYWGNNLFWNPGAFPSFTGWAAILDNNDVLRDVVFMNWPAANIAAASITVGTVTITPAGQWTGDGVNTTTVAATNSMSRIGTSDNNNAADFAILPLSIGSTNPSMTLPFTGFGCAGTRVPVQVVVAPCNSELNLKLYIQAYWDGTSAMLPVLANQFEPTTANACDSVTIQLRDAITYGVVQSVKTVLNQDGTVACVFPPVSGNYYVAVQHRNAIETWSANPIAIGSTPVSYDFTTAANKAYGDNQIQVSTGIWAFYSGDVLKDFAESIDLGDLNQVETEINNFSFGYFAEDLNGDGNVDLGDTPFLEDNINSFIFSNHP
jgi:hypothetical protein